MNHTFMSDNAAGVHPQVMKVLEDTNLGSTGLYGADLSTQMAEESFRGILGENIEVFFVFGGTAANVLGLSTMLEPHEAIICAESAHIHQDESGAPERFTGSKLLTVPTEDGKLTNKSIGQQMHGFGDQHHVQPKVISISQATEYGTVYSDQEIERLADFAHHRSMFLHVDGARIANAEASEVNFRIRRMDYSGVDVMSFGGTKNGMMYGEAIVFFRPQLADRFQWVRKQGMQLAGKMRFISAQFRAMFSEDLWVQNAQYANFHALRLAEAIIDIEQIEITRPVHSNAVFARFPRAMITYLKKEYAFYVWDGDEEIRLMTSWHTSEDDIAELVEYLKRFSFPGHHPRA